MNIKEKNIDSNLTINERRFLIETARDAIRHAVLGKKYIVPTSASATLKEKRGVFVSLHCDGSLRGCIGRIETFEPLYVSVAELAVSAATEDPRFPAVAPRELESVEIEISVLSPLELIDDITRIEVGKHGLFLRKQIFSGLLLPQVATKYGWDRIAFLEETCTKAGLGRNEWKKDSNIYIFSAEVFSEKDLAG
ncbi:MAG: AmmeMemoRadiSam system protein A [Candidatus Schekmanbacteria bacterium]|nr:AmmeMemoRadiSam system protein A [Candidatus Schekmanbacteria bacterium]